MSNIGEVFIQKKQYDSAYFYIKKALDISIITNNFEGIAIKQNQNNYSEAITYFDKSLSNLTKYKNKRYLSNTLINKGLCLVKLNKNSTALTNINNGLTIAKKINSTENIALGYKALVNYYSNKNEYKKALEYHKKSTSFYDSILNIESKKSIINSQIAYESFKKDEEIQKLAKEKEESQKKSKNRFNRLLYGLLGSILVIFGLLYLRFLSKKNTDLELDNKNNEIQNYLFQIKELKNNSSDIKNDEVGFENYNLSKREQEIFMFISKGLTNSEIAEKIFLSKNTVKTHIQNIYSKLDVKNRIQALKK